MKTQNPYCAKPLEQRVLPATIRLFLDHKPAVQSNTIALTMKLRGLKSGSGGWDLEGVTYEAQPDPEPQRSWYAVISPGICSRGDDFSWLLHVYNSQRVRIMAGTNNERRPLGEWNMWGAEFVGLTTLPPQ